MCDYIYIMNTQQTFMKRMYGRFQMSNTLQKTEKIGLIHCILQVIILIYFATHRVTYVHEAQGSYLAQTNWSNEMIYNTSF